MASYLNLIFRTWLEAHPNEPEPKNYSEFPGKMDHVTAVAITPG
jgi:hypothetical protein